MRALWIFLSLIIITGAAGTLWWKWNDASRLLQEQQAKIARLEADLLRQRRDEKRARLQESLGELEKKLQAQQKLVEDLNQKLEQANVAFDKHSSDRNFPAELAYQRSVIESLEQQLAFQKQNIDVLKQQQQAMRQNQTNARRASLAQLQQQIRQLQGDIDRLQQETQAQRTRKLFEANYVESVRQLQENRKTLHQLQQRYQDDRQSLGHEPDLSQYLERQNAAGVETVKKQLEQEYNEEKARYQSLLRESAENEKHVVLDTKARQQLQDQYQKQKQKLEQLQLDVQSKTKTLESLSK